MSASTISHMVSVSPFAIDQTARARWMQLMTAALPDAGLDDDDDAMLLAFFEQVATHMMNR